MKYEKSRYITTALAFVSIIIAISGVLIVPSNINNFFKGIDNYEILIAMLATVFSIFAGLGSVFLKHSLNKIKVKNKIFIAYSKSDYEKAKNIYDYLLENDLNPWIDSENIYPGDKWQVVIENAIEESSAILILVSDKSINNSYLHIEIQKSLAITQVENDSPSTVIPVRLTESPLPKGLEDIQAFDYFESKQSLDPLLTSLKRVLI